MCLGQARWPLQNRRCPPVRGSRVARASPTFQGALSCPLRCHWPVQGRYLRRLQNKFVMLSMRPLILWSCASIVPVIFSLPKRISSAARPPIATSICVMSSDLEMCDLSFSGMKAVCPPDIPFATIVTCNHQVVTTDWRQLKLKCLSPFTLWIGVALGVK